MPRNYQSDRRFSLYLHLVHYLMILVLLWLLIFLSSCISVTIILLLLLTVLSECFKLYHWNSYMNHHWVGEIELISNLGLSRPRGRVSSSLLWWWVMSILLKISLELVHPFWVFSRVIVNSMFGGMRLIDAK